MASAIPLFKVAVLLVKTATKPMARALKTRAVNSPSLSSACHFVGQQWHSQTTRLNLMVQGHRVKGVKPLNEGEAIQSGAELLTETFVLSVGIGALVAEGRRSARANAEKAAQKDARRTMKREALNAEFARLGMHLHDVIVYTSAVSQAVEQHMELVLKGERKEALERSLKSFPKLPESLKVIADLHEEGGMPEQGPILTREHTHDDFEPWYKAVTSKIGMNGIRAAIKYVGGVFDGEDGVDLGDDDDDDEEDDDDEDEDEGDGGEE